MHIMHMAVAVILRCNAHLIVHGEQQPNFEQEGLWRRHPQRAADPYFPSTCCYSALGHLPRSSINAALEKIPGLLCVRVLIPTNPFE
jgi:hypothetical protein